jgi:glycosyltransferase involved in cell wall biosynthesis
MIAQRPAAKNLVVIPAFNEENALPSTIAALQSLPDDFELLVVNDGSTDATAELAKQLAAGSRVTMHVVDLPFNGGIGVAVQTGYVFAAQYQRYDYVIQFDGDGQHDVTCLPRLVEACKLSNLDVCIGSRFLQDHDTGYRSTFCRRIGIRFLAGLISWLGGVRVTDPTSGSRCVGRRAWSVFARQYPEDYPEPESLYWCIRNGLRVAEIPVVMHARATGTSSISTLRAAYYIGKVTLAILIDRIRPKENPLV